MKDLTALRGMRKHLIDNYDTVAHEWADLMMSSNGTPCLVGWYYMYGSGDIAFWKRNNVDFETREFATPNGRAAILQRIDRAIARQEEFEASPFDRMMEVEQ